jgi:electron transport complex protein RnfB
MRAMDPLLADRIDALLPQTQCTRCGFDGCRPYAEALAAGGSDVNRCPPGGDATIAQLAAITGRAARALDPACGIHAELALARIDEARCIGCTLCLAACPVDAILGGPRRMHAILATRCTGCERCLPPCPVDCIEMIPAGRPWTADCAAAARTRHAARAARLAHGERIAGRRPARSAAADAASSRRAAIAAALARAQARRTAGRTTA